MADGYFTTTSYGTWLNHGDDTNDTVGGTILDAVNGGDREWIERMEASGALERIEDDYRAAINAALPERVSLLRSNEFQGPKFEADYTWKDDFEIKDVVKGVDLQEIIDRHDVGFG